MTGLNVAVWSEADIALPLAAGLLMIIALFALNMSYGYFVETRSKRQFTELFGQYVPPELVDEMARDPAKYSMEGKNEDLTVLFSDIRGFTSIAEGLDPKALAALLNEFLTAMSLVIRNHRGTLDKYMGDAIMAFWGAPVADPQHASHALAAALAMQAELARLNPVFKARGWKEIKIGVGVEHRPDERRGHGLAAPQGLHGHGRRGESRVAARGAHQGIRCRRSSSARRRGKR